MNRALLTFIYICAVAGASGGDADARQLRAAYRSFVYTESWVPIRVADMEATIAQHVLEGLGGKGRLTLARAPSRGEPPDVDLSLIIEGDLVGEASSFVVTLTLRPLRDPTLPSFAASATGSMSGLKRVPAKRRKPLIYKAIVQAARGAVARLNRAFEASHGQTRGAAAPRVSEMFDWTRIKPPRGGGSGQDYATFARVNADRTKRMRAGERLSTHAYDDPSIRHLFERAALSDPDPIIRYYALRYLGPCSRRYRFTKRVILSALREDNDPRVKSTAFEMSRSFISELPAETVQSWVELLRSKPAEFKDMRSLEKLMRDRLDAPNLDSALLECLQQKTILISTSSTRKGHCLGLAGNLPRGRRLRLLLAYVGGPSAPVDKHERRRAAQTLQHAVAVERGGYQESLAVTKLAVAAYKKLSEPEFKETLAKGLVKNYPHPGAVEVVADALSRTSDPFFVSAAVRWLTHNVTPRYQRYPPWAVLSWDAAERELKRLMESPPSGLRPHNRRSLERDAKRGLEGLAAMRAIPQRRDLAKLLDADEQPKSVEALDYFVRCVLESSDPEVQTDCAAGVHWLAVFIPELRRRAVAAAAGLLQQKRRAIEEKAREILEHVPKTVSSFYRGFTGCYCRRAVCCRWGGM